MSEILDTDYEYYACPNCLSGGVVVNSPMIGSTPCDCCQISVGQCGECRGHGVLIGRAVGERLVEFAAIETERYFQRVRPQEDELRKAVWLPKDKLSKKGTNVVNAQDIANIAEQVMGYNPAANIRQTAYVTTGQQYTNAAWPRLEFAQDGALTAITFESDYTAVTNTNPHTDV